MNAAADGERVVWDVVEEHLDEAAFLWTQRQGALAAPDVTLDRLELGDEERLLGHVDGLVAGGAAVRTRVLLPELEGDEGERVAAAALALLASEVDEAAAAVTAAFERAADDARSAIGRALGVADAPPSGNAGARRPVDDRLRALARTGDPALRAAALDALVARGADPGAALGAVRAGDDAALVAAALRAAAAAPEPLLAELAAAALDSPVPAVRDEAITAGLLFGQATAWALCKKLVAGRDPTCARLLWLCAVGGGSREHELVTSALASAELRSAALWALGFGGRAAGADACLAWIADPDAGRVAGEAFAAITGVPFAPELLAAPPPPPDDDAGDVVVTPSPEAKLPALDAAATEAWWRDHRSSFDPERRYLGGHVLTGETAVAALARGPMRRRHAIALEIALKTAGRYSIETRALARRQRVALAALARMPADALARRLDGAS